MQTYKAETSSAINHRGALTTASWYEDTSAVVCARIRGKEGTPDEIMGGPTDPATGVHDHAADRHR